MKNYFFLSALLLFSGILHAQTPNYKVVFDLTSRDTVDHQNVIRWVKEIASSTPDAQLEVVMYGKSLDMVVRDRSSVTSDLAKLTTMKNVHFKVCAVAMKNNHIEASQLLPGVEIVPDGIYEIITRQREGWGYIKAVR
jgi:intracellular sulfur oxidation DsrE/DsrF family protein